MSSSSASKKAVVAVKVFSDIVWPFCFTAKRAIELAATKANIDLQLHWLPFQLNPFLGPEGDDKLQAYMKKFGPQAERMLKDPNNQLCRLGQHLNREAAKICNSGENSPPPPPVDFKYIEGSRVFNTMKCHMLVAHDAVEHDPKLQNHLMEVMFRKYFIEGKDLSINDELFDAAKECGISKEVVEDAVVKQNDSLAQKVKGQLASARGIRGVPYFKFPDGEVVNGSESIDTFQELLEACASTK